MTATEHATPGALTAASLTDVTVTYGDRTALAGCSLTIPRGGVFGLLGVNGAGKTMILRLLLGLIAPDRGAVRVLGMDPARAGDAVRARAGVLLEHHGLYERLDAYENLRFAAGLCGLPTARFAARTRELLGAFQLWDRRGERVGTWSRGMKVRLAIVRALLHSPELLVLDEPTAGLDPVAAQTLRAELGAILAAAGCTVLLTTHNLAEAERLCTHVGILHEGRIIAQDATADLVARASSATQIVLRGASATLAELLMRRPDVFNVRLRDGVLELTAASEAATAAVLDQARLAGADVARLGQAESSLESAFLRLLVP